MSRIFTTHCSFFEARVDQDLYSLESVESGSVSGTNKQKNPVRPDFTFFATRSRARAMINYCPCLFALHWRACFQHQSPWNTSGRCISGRKKKAWQQPPIQSIMLFSFVEGFLPVLLIQINKIKFTFSKLTIELFLINGRTDVRFHLVLPFCKLLRVICNPKFSTLHRCFVLEQIIVR